MFSSNKSDPPRHDNHKLHNSNKHHISNVNRISVDLKKPWVIATKSVTTISEFFLIVWPLNPERSGPKMAWALAVSLAVREELWVEFFLPVALKPLYDVFQIITWALREIFADSTFLLLYLSFFHGRSGWTWLLFVDHWCQCMGVPSRLCRNAPFP